MNNKKGSVGFGLVFLIVALAFAGGALVALLARPVPKSIGGTSGNSFTVPVVFEDTVQFNGDFRTTSSTLTRFTVGTSTQITGIKCTNVIYDPPSLNQGSSTAVDVTLSGVVPSSTQVLWASFTTNASTSYIHPVVSASSSNVANVVITDPMFVNSAIGATKNLQQGTLNVCVMSF